MCICYLSVFGIDCKFMQHYFSDLRQQSGLETDILQGKVKSFIKIIKNIPLNEEYNFISAELNDFYDGFKLTHYNYFHKIILLELMASFQMAAMPLALPRSMGEIYAAEFKRIKALVNNDEAFVFDWKNDLFAKDMAICSGRILPVGPGLVEVSGVPRSLVFQKGLIQFLKFSYLLLVKLKSPKPILEIHTHLANVENFNPKGWMRAYYLIAEILELNPQYKGVMRSSWFIDPFITGISPHLSYLLYFPVSHGAYYFYHSDEGRKSGAFARSASRLKLYESGKYRPKTYYMIWPRQDVIKMKNLLQE